MARKKSPDTPASSNVITFGKRPERKKADGTLSGTASATRRNCDDQANLELAVRGYRTVVERELFKLDTIVQSCAMWRKRSELSKGPERVDLLLEMSVELTESVKEKYGQFCELAFALRSEEQP